MEQRSSEIYASKGVGAVIIMKSDILQNYQYPGYCSTSLSLGHLQAAESVCSASAMV
jgi:hypothetical protein